MNARPQPLHAPSTPAHPLLTVLLSAAPGIFS